MLALCEALDMPVNFIAPAFGLQKNLPFGDNARLRGMVERQWAVARQFGVSLGFHSGSGKSAGNYRVMGEVTGGRLEIKTSGRYTFEMGVALSASPDPADQALWRDWYHFTLALALAGAFSADESERGMARTFIAASLAKAGGSEDVFASQASCRAAMEALSPARTTCSSSSTTSSLCSPPGVGRRKRPWGTTRRRATPSAPASMPSAPPPGCFTRRASPAT